MAVLKFEEADGARVSFIELDATTAEEHGSTATMTRHPVEEGEAIADYRQVEPEMLTLEGIITNTPVPQLNSKATPAWIAFSPLTQQNISLTLDQRVQTRGAVVGGGGQAPFNPPGFKIPPTPPTVEPATSEIQTSSVGWQAQVFAQPIDRVNVIYSRLLELHTRGTLTEIDTELKVYKDMVLVSISASREPMDALPVSLKFERVRTAETQVATVTRRVRVTSLKAAKPVVSTPAPPSGPKGKPRQELEELRKSILAAGLSG